MKTIKKLSQTEWNKLVKSNKNKEFITVPWSIFSDSSSLIDDYTDFSEETFADFKAFVLLQWELGFMSEDKDGMDMQELKISNFKRLKTNHRVRETNLSVLFQFQYAEEARNGFLRLPYTSFDKCQGKLAMLIEAILSTYTIESPEMLWRVIVSKFGASVFKQSNVKRYWDKSFKKYTIVKGKETLDTSDGVKSFSLNQGKNRFEDKGVRHAYNS